MFGTKIITSLLRIYLLNRDTKMLAKIDFDNLPSEDDWSLIQSDIE